MFLPLSRRNRPASGVGAFLGVRAPLMTCRCSFASSQETPPQFLLAEVTLKGH